MRIDIGCRDIPFLSQEIEGEWADWDLLCIPIHKRDVKNFYKWQRSKRIAKIIIQPRR